MHIRGVPLALKDQKIRELGDPCPRPRALLLHHRQDPAGKRECLDHGYASGVARGADPTTAHHGVIIF